MRYAILVHGGVGSPKDNDAGCIRAAEAGEKVLAEGGSALEAVVAATVELEDEPTYNAGIGSRPRLNFECEMDAGLMTSDGKIGIVAAIKRVKNPVLVALKVMEETPHVILAGEGANEFARQKGFPDFDPVTDYRREILKGLIEKIKKGEEEKYMRYRGIVDGCDTVGAVALDSEGNFASANSTGGTNIQLPGRIGDSPVVGAGFFAGPAGAIVTTGLGEEIIRRMSAVRAHDAMAAGADAQKACEDATSVFKDEFSFGILAMTRDAAAWTDNRQMPVAVRSR